MDIDGSLAQPTLHVICSWAQSRYPVWVGSSAVPQHDLTNVAVLPYSALYP